MDQLEQLTIDLLFTGEPWENVANGLLSWIPNWSDSRRLAHSLHQVPRRAGTSVLSPGGGKRASACFPDSGMGLLLSRCNLDTLINLRKATLSSFR